jgi:hypothetical protein
MSCNTTTIEIVQGDILTKTYTFTYQDSGDPYDLSIYSEIRMQIRKKSGDPVIAEGALTTGEFAVSGVGDNVLEMSGITIPDDTPTGQYMYDIEFSATGIRDTLIAGRILVKAQITE